MPFKPSITINYTSSGNNALTSTITREGDAEQAFDIVIPANATAYQADIAIEVDQLKLFYLLCNDGDITLKTNSSSAPDDTRDLDKGEALIWVDGDGNAPFTEDVATIFFANSSDAAVTVNLRLLLDVTAS